MKLAILLLVGMVAAAPTIDNKDEKLFITKAFFPDNLVLYSGKHDIVDIIVPLNNINFPDESSECLDVDHPNTIFFVEADIDDKGVKDYKGLYVFKDNKAKKILDNGQCATYSKDKIVYFGAKDGIYKYNNDELTATKYGTVTDSVIKLAIDTEHARVYYLTEDYVLYKYNENEVESVKVDAVKDARDITFDFDGILFFYDGQKQFYTYNGEKVVKVAGLPASPSKVELIRVPVMVDAGFALIDGKLYAMQANGTSEITPIEFKTVPTAFAPEIVSYQYYAYNKKLYGYNFVNLLADKSIDGLNEFFEDKEDQVNAIKSTKVSSRL